MSDVPKRVVKIVRIKPKPQKVQLKPQRVQPKPEPSAQNTGKEIIFYLGGCDSKTIEEGKLMAEKIRSSNAILQHEPLPLIYCGNKPDEELFYECLDVYENNQICFKDNIEELIKLEIWFSQISEPFESGPEWKIRECNRRRYHISDYCNPKIRKQLLSCRRSNNKTTITSD